MRAFDVRSNLQEFLAGVDRTRLDQVPQALAWTLNGCIDAAKPGVRAEMQRVFEDPTPFTLNSVYGSYANKRRLEAHLMLKDFKAGNEAAPGTVNKGTPAGVYLRPQIEGGARALKRFEAVLRGAGLLPPSQFAVPARECPRDGYGNVPHGFIIRVLSDLRSWKGDGFRANRSGPRMGARRSNYFFAVPDPRRRIKNNHLKPGIYWHMPNGMLAAIFHFTRQPQYGSRFDFYGKAEQLSRAEFDRQWPVQWKRALATDRGVRKAA